MLWPLDRPTLEGLAHQTELALRQTAEESEVHAESKSATCPLVELEDKIIKDKAESTIVENGKVEKVRVGNDRVEKDKVNPTATPQATRQSRCESTKTIDPIKHGEDDQPAPKSYIRGEATHKTPNGSNNTDHPTEMIAKPEPKSTAPKRSGRARRPVEFHQPGHDYVNYMDASESSSYE